MTDKEAIQFDALQLRADNAEKLVEKAYKEGIEEFDKGNGQWWWERSAIRKELETK